ncbi:MAG: DHHA1 domain-containing protein [Candidatus Jordarchaeales archaeon]
MKVAVHGTDCDGIISAALILLKDPDAEILFVNNPKDALSLMETLDVVADLPKSPNCKANIDHHESNYRKLVEEGRLTEKDLVIPSAPAAAKLVAEYFNLKGGVADELVEMAVAADTGKHTDKTLKLDRVIKFLHDDDEGRRRLAKILAEKGASFIEDEWFKEQYSKLKDIEKLEEWLNSVVASLGNVNGALVFVDEVDAVPYYMAKDIAHKLLAKGCSAVIVAYKNPESPGKVKLSVRVGEESSIDARIITEPFGGGGHAKAAGATVEEKDMLWLLRAFAEHSQTKTVLYLRLQPPNPAASG